MWYQSPLIGPMGQGPPELQSVAAAQFLVPPGFGPMRMTVLDDGSPQSTGIYNGFSLYSHSYTPHFPPPQYYPPPPQPIPQFPQFHTQMTTMVDSGHSVFQIHSTTPHTHNQSYPSHPLYHQLTSNSPEGFSQPSVHFIPTKTTITPPICQYVSLSQHNPPLGCVKLEEALNSHTPSLTEMRLQPNFIIDGSPKEKLKSARVKGEFKVISRIMMKRERRLGFNRRKKFQLSPIMNSFLELSVHGDNFASGASLGKSNPSDDVITEVKQDLSLSTTKSISVHQSKLLHETSEVWHRGQHSEPEITLASHPCVEACFQLEEQEDHGWVNDKLVGLPPRYGQLHKLSNVNSEFNACKQFDKRSQLEGLFSERMIADAVVDRLLSKVETVFEGFKSAIPDRSYNNLFVKFGCLHKDQLHKLSNVKSEFNALQLFDKRLQLEGLYSEGRIGDAMFGWLLESVIVPPGDMNSIGASLDFFFEVFPSLPYTYHNWRAILNWFVAAVIQCSIDPSVFIDNILLGGIGERVSLNFAKIELKLDKAFKEMLIKRYESKMISSPVTSDGLAHKWVHCLCRTGFQFTISFKLALIDLLRFGFIDKNMQVVAFLVNIIGSGLMHLHHEHVKNAHKPFHEILMNGIGGVNRNRLEKLIECVMTKLITFAGTLVEYSSLATQNYKPIIEVDIWKINRVMGFEDQVEIVVKVYESYECCQLQMQVDHRSRVSSLVVYTSGMQPEHEHVIGSNRDQCYNPNGGVKWVGVIHIFNQPSSYSLEVIGFLITAFELSHWRYEIISWFLLLNLYMWLQQSLQFIIHNETTSATLLWFLVVNCDSRFLVVNCGSLPEQRHNYLKITCDLEGQSDWKWCQRYQVAVGIVAFGLHNFSITKHLQQYGSLKIIQRKFSLEVFQVYNSNFGKVSADNSYFLWPFVLVTKHLYEENALTVALQSNEQLINIKTELSDGIHMTKYGNKMLDYEISVGIDVNYSILVVVLGLISVITIWFATVAYLVQTAILLVDGDNLLGRHEFSNKGSQQVIESFFEKEHCSMGSMDWSYCMENAEEIMATAWDKLYLQREGVVRTPISYWAVSHSTRPIFGSA